MATHGNTWQYMAIHGNTNLDMAIYTVLDTLK